VIDDLGLDDHKLHTDFDLDAEEDETQEVTYVLEWRRWWHKILAGEAFDRLIGLAILLNAVVVAAQVDADAKRRYGPLPRDPKLDMLEKLFVFLYTMELALRVFVYRAAAFKNAWVKFDMILVIFSWAELIAEGIKRLDPNSEEALVEGGLGMFRLFRLGKLVRPLRLIGQFRSVWLLVRGMFRSFFHVLTTFILIALFLFIFGCLILELIAKDPLRDTDLSYDSLIEFYFPDLYTTLISLSQFVILDNVYEIYREIVLKNPTWTIIFSALVITIPVSLLTLVTAIILEEALEQTATEKALDKQLRQHEVRAQLPGIKAMFRDLDASGDGFFTRTEFDEVPHEMKEELLLMTELTDYDEIFDFLDGDDDGQISIDEFVQGLQYIISSPVNFEAMRLRKMLLKERIHIQTIQETCDNIYGVVYNNFIALDHQSVGHGTHL
jgi:voltage-gated sodium channel